MKLKRKPDVEVENCGNFYLFRALTARAARWIDRHVEANRIMFAGALAVDHRFARDLADAMLADGLGVI